MTENVRQQGVYSMRACAAIRDAMTSLTGKHHTTSHQHVEFGEARRQHDLRDMNKLIDCFRSHDPFDGNVPQLRSLASGLASSEGHGINCDETEKVGRELQRNLDSVSVRNATTKRLQMVYTLNELKPGVKVDKQTVQIDPSTMFLRCTALAQREHEDITAYIAHEMTAVPTSLFRDFFMRKVDKSEPGREIKKNVRNIMPDYATQLPLDIMPVIDGGWLLHFIRWKKNVT